MEQYDSFEQLLCALDKLEFYKYVPGGEKDSVKTAQRLAGDLFPDTYKYRPGESARSDWAIVDMEAPDATKRAYFVDAENLYEQGAARFVKEIIPVLSLHGLLIREVTDRIAVNTYALVLDGEEFMIYDATKRDKDMWMYATKRVLAALNTRFHLARCDERLFYRYGGNDTQVIFLTEEMYRVIKASRLIPDSECPQAVT
jgi:hypothetical protein